MQSVLWRPVPTPSRRNSCQPWGNANKTCKTSQSSSSSAPRSLLLLLAPAWVKDAPLTPTAHKRCRKLRRINSYQHVSPTNLARHCRCRMLPRPRVRILWEPTFVSQQTLVHLHQIPNTIAFLHVRFSMVHQAKTRKNERRQQPPSACRCPCKPAQSDLNKLA